MPEGDTLVRTAAGLRPHLLGRRIVAAHARAPGPRAELLVGATVTAIEPSGKHLLVRFDNGLTLHTHLRMHGSWHRYRPAERWRLPAGRARIALEVNGSVVVCFDAPVVELLESRAERLHPALAALGPDLLAAGWDEDEALRRLRAPAGAGRAIAEALLDQRVVAGIGNEVRNETLWRARRSPWTPIGALADHELLAILRQAAAILREGARTGRRPSNVQRRTGRPCPACGTRIASVLQGRGLPRRTYWCPVCQPDPSGIPVARVPG